MLMKSQEVQPSWREALHTDFHGRPVLLQVREFGALVALILCIVAGYVAYHGALPSMVLPLLVTGLITWGVGIWGPEYLYPVWSAWMALAEVLGVVTTFVILGVLWALLMVPTAMLLRLLGKKVMDLSFRTTADSYWLTPAPGRDDFQRMDRQY